MIRRAITLPQDEVEWPSVLRMRDIAVVGQIGVLVLALILGMGFPVWPVTMIVGVTALSNVALRWVKATRPQWLAPREGQLLPVVIFFDLAAFTGLMCLTGGANNPLCLLYLVHVAMSVVLLPGAWAIAAVAAAAVAYGLLTRWHVELTIPPAVQGAAVAGRWVSLTIGAGLIAYFIYLVNRAAAARNRRLDRLREVAADNRRLASMATLAAGAAHELGTPLGTIAMAAREIERAVEGPPDAADAEVAEVAEDARLIRDQADRCRAILDRLRTEEVAAWLGQVPERMTQAELAKRLLGELSQPERARVEVELESPADPVRVVPPATAQITTVLLRNALDASRPQQPVRLVIDRSGRALRLRVIDSGTGVEPEVLDKVFEPFVTTKPAGEGMGLGLYLAKLTADAMGAELEIQSRSGRGAQAMLSIPDDGLGEPPHAQHPPDRDRALSRSAQIAPAPQRA